MLAGTSALRPLLTQASLSLEAPQSLPSPSSVTLSFFRKTRQLAGLTISVLSQHLGKHSIYIIRVRATPMVKDLSGSWFAQAGPVHWAPIKANRIACMSPLMACVRPFLEGLQHQQQVFCHFHASFTGFGRRASVKLPCWLSCEGSAGQCHG